MVGTCREGDAMSKPIRRKARQRRDRRVVVLLTEREYRQLVLQSVRTCRTVSAYVRWALVQALNTKGR